MIEHGKKYQITDPNYERYHGLPNVNVTPATEFRTPITTGGKTVVVVDCVGDIIQASDRVSYPIGSDPKLRHTEYIAKYSARFKPITETTNEDKENGE